MTRKSIIYFAIAGLALLCIGPRNAKADFQSLGTGSFCDDPETDNNASCDVSYWDDYSDGGDGNDHYTWSWSDPQSTGFALEALDSFSSTECDGTGSASDEYLGTGGYTVKIYPDLSSSAGYWGDDMTSWVNYGANFY